MAQRSVALPQNPSSDVRPILVLLLYAASPAPSWGSCLAVYTNPLSAIAESGPLFTVSVVRVDSVWREGRNYRSTGVVKEQLYGPTLPRRVRVASGFEGDANGAAALEVGREYLVFSRRHGGDEISVYGCDALSGAVRGVGTSIVTVRALRRYFAAVRRGRSGPLRLVFRDGSPLAEGRLEHGKPAGTWTYYRHGGERERTVTYAPSGTVHTRIYRGFAGDGQRHVLSSERFVRGDTTVERELAPLRPALKRTTVRLPGPNHQRRETTELEAREDVGAIAYTCLLATDEDGHHYTYTIARLERTLAGDTAYYFRSAPTEDSARLVRRLADGSYQRLVVAHPSPGAFFDGGFSESGQARVVMRLRHGLADGPYEAYWDDGSLRERGTMLRGRRGSDWETFPRPAEAD